MVCLLTIWTNSEVPVEITKREGNVGLSSASLDVAAMVPDLDKVGNPSVTDLLLAIRSSSERSGPGLFSTRPGGAFVSRLEVVD